MLKIIHGDNHFSSRQTLDQIRKSQSVGNLEIVDASSLSLTKLVQMVEGGSLFGEGKVIIIENLLSQKIKENGQIFEYLKKLPSEVNCTLWEPKEIGKTILANFPKARVFLFKLEKQIFNFLESLKPGNSGKSLALFHSALERDEPEMIFFMIVRQIRRLLLIKTQSLFLDSMSPWQEKKIRSQAEWFTADQLEKVYRELLNIDFSIKSGQSAMDLMGRLDMFLLNL